MEMIEMRNISKIYRTKYVETHALSEININVEDGEFVSMMGPSGSGKTTFMNIVGLLDDFDDGTLALDGLPIRKLSDRKISRLRNEKIGFVFQSFNLISDFNVFDNVEMPLRYRRMKSKERREAVKRAVAEVGLSSRIKHYPSQLSGGQQQRVAVARALAGKPKLILADEPTGNLDTLMAMNIMDLIDKINDAGTTVVMVTHDPELGSRAPRQLHLLDGRLIDVAKMEAHTPLVESADSARANLQLT
ncbi:MAG: ABC transporter ATP-binding protein [Proteobacteria bacterium]|nr:ABC transporter ATP-binding protein [Pseudomonadota bacterium]